MDLSLNISRPSSTSTSRILYDIPCKVCQDHSSGKHYGIFACDGCAGFFKRSIRRNRQYVCKAKEVGLCLVDKTHRNQCRACRLTRCVEAGMNKDAVQHERGPRNSTIRRQMSLLYGEGVGSPGGAGIALSPPSLLAHAQSVAATSARLSATSTASPTASPQPSEAHTSQANWTPADEGSDRASSPEASETAAGAEASTAASQPLLPSHPLPLTCLTLPKGEQCGGVRLEGGGLCESAARILFGNVEWAKYLPAFSSLPHKDQTVLLQNSWRQLFVLSLAQTLLPVEADQLLQLVSRDGCQLPATCDQQLLELLQNIGHLRDTVCRLRALQVDATEYMCLKWIVLFHTDLGSCSALSGQQLHQPAAVSLLQDQAQLALFRYVTAAHPCQPIRLSRLLLLTAALKDTASSGVLERLFFERTLRNFTVERLIGDMLKKNDS